MSKEIGKKLISVIVPVYNVETYLNECVDSILRQTYKNLEIILVDDGSTDNSGAICDEYAKKDSRIKVFHKENGGASTARNYGIDQANGEFLGFVDSDDYIEKELYELLMESLVKNNADVSACGYISFRDGSNEKEERIDFYGGEVFTSESFAKILSLEKNGAAVISPCNKLYKREVFSKIRYPEGQAYEDPYVITDIFDSIEKFVFVKKALYYYRQRQGSIVHSISAKSLDEMDAWLKRLYWFSDRREFAYLKQTMDVTLSRLVFYDKELKRKNKYTKKRIASYKKEIHRCFKNLSREFLTTKEKIKYGLAGVSLKFVWWLK